MTTAFDKEWHSKEAHKSIDKLVAVITQLEKEKEQLSFDFAVAKIEVLEPYIMPRTGTDFLRQQGGRDHADRLYEKDKIIREQNRPRLESNRKLKDALTALMRGLGFPEATRGYTSTRSHKMVSQPAGWIQTLNTIPAYESSTDNIDRIYENWCKIIKEAEASRAKVTAEKERQARAEEKERMKIRTLVELGVKYGAEFAGVYDAIHFILDRDKYLRLAYYLEKNRGDWTEGPDYAKTGIEGFRIDPASPVDGDISREIWGHVSDWDGDGRVFRDCAWNYGVLYNMANVDLLADFEKLREYEER